MSDKIEGLNIEEKGLMCICCDKKQLDGRVYRGKFICSDCLGDLNDE